MKKKLLGYDQVTRAFEPTFEQISLSNFFEDPLNVYYLDEGVQVRVFDKNGGTIKAFARSYADGLILSCRLPCSSFQYGQKILIFVDVGSKCFAIQTVIKSAHMGDLYVEDTSTRFYPRFKTAIRATACPVPAHFIHNIMKGKWYIERHTESTSAGKHRIKDVMIDWKSNEMANAREFREQKNVLLTSISQGGFALTRNVAENTKPLRHIMVSYGYYQKKSFIQLDLLAIARCSRIEDGIETINFCLVSPMSTISEEIFLYEKKFTLIFSERVEIFINGEKAAHSDKLNLLLPPGDHEIKLVTQDGLEYKEGIKIDSFRESLGSYHEYNLFDDTPLTCTAIEKEHQMVGISFT